MTMTPPLFRLLPIASPGDLRALARQEHQPLITHDWTKGMRA